MKRTGKLDHKCNHGCIVAWSGSHTVYMDLGTRQLRDVIKYSTVCM